MKQAVRGTTPAAPYGATPADVVRVGARLLGIKVEIDCVAVVAEG